MDAFDSTPEPAPTASHPTSAATPHDLAARLPVVAYVFRIDVAGTPSFTYVSPACADVYGFTAAQAIADVRLMHDAIHPLDLDRFTQAGAASLEAMQPVAWEGRILRTDGRERNVLITSQPQRHPDGTVEWHGVVTPRRHLTAEPAPPEAVTKAADAAAPGTDEAAGDPLELTLGIVGHEIGAPLAAITGYAEWGLELLQRNPPVVPDETAATVLTRCFQVIARQSQRLNQVRTDLLTMATANAGAIYATPESVNVAERLNAAAEVRLRDLDVTIDCPPNLACLVEPGHLDHILTNLVSNAERYAESRIWLSAAATGSHVRITVADDGPGVAPSMVSRLFTRFAHAGAASNDKAGTGLGLYIVRTLTLANAGTVVYEPDRRGARFTVALPAAP